MYSIIRDTREQEGQGWWFGPTDEISGTVRETMPTGDYCIRGLEDKVIIERKGTTGEFAKNICEKRFFRELERMDDFTNPYLILEFSWEDMLRFPYNSGIPKSKWCRLKVKPKFILKSLHLIELKYKPKIIFAPHDGRERAALIFKYASQIYG